MEGGETGRREEKQKSCYADEDNKTRVCRRLRRMRAE